MSSEITPPAPQQILEQPLAAEQINIGPAEKLRSKVRWLGATVGRIAVAGICVASGLVAMTGTAEACSGTHCDAQGTVELAGSSWLNGNGVDVYANNGSAAYDSGVNDYINNSEGKSTLAGEEWQCVELINRLYLSKGWISGTWFGNGNQLYANAPSNLSKEGEGSITYLNPGDVVALDGGESGHAAIVNSYDAGTGGVSLVNQNTADVSSSAKLSEGTLTMSGWWGDNYSVQGVIHHPDMTNEAAPTTPSPPPVVGLRAPSAVYDSATGKNVFYIGPDNAVWQYGVSGTAWKKFRIGGAAAINSSPSAIVDPGTGRNVFYVGSDMSIHQETAGPSGWADYDLDGTAAAPNSSPSAVEDPNLGRQIFYVGSDNAIWQWSASNGRWENVRIGGSVAANSSPSVTDDPTYGRQIFYVGPDGAINQLAVSGNGWANYRMGGTAATNTSPSAVIDSATGRNVFFEGTDGAVYQWSVSNGAWTQFKLGGGAAGNTSPNAVSDSKNGRNIFFIGGNGTAYQWSVNGNSWVQYPLGTGSVAAATGTSLEAIDDPAVGREIYYMGADGAMHQWSVNGTAWANANMG